MLDDRKTLTLTSSQLKEIGGAKPGQLGLLLAARDSADAPLTWQFVPLDEVGYAYVARRRCAACLRTSGSPTSAKFLEHANPLLAEDAYLEFGRASYDEVAAVAQQLPFAAMRRWIVDPRVPEARKGFYGLALGLADSEADRANRQLLESLVDQPADDFRAGYDGVLGGYLVLAVTAGLAHLDELLLANPAARTGDLRHAQTALRFMHEFGRGAIPAADLHGAMRRLLDHPETAAAAIVDLARWQDWDSLETVVSLFDREGYPDQPTTRAIVGYLNACPRPAAAAALAQLRHRAPQRIADAEKQPLTPATPQ